MASVPVPVPVPEPTRRRSKVIGQRPLGCIEGGIKDRSRKRSPNSIYVREDDWVLLSPVAAAREDEEIKEQ